MAHQLQRRESSKQRVGVPVAAPQWDAAALRRAGAERVGELVQVTRAEARRLQQVVERVLQALLLPLALLGVRAGPGAGPRARESSGARAAAAGAGASRSFAPHS
jgi:hypothetical protein